MSGSAPVTGTVPGTGAMGRAYGLMLRWWRMVANQPTRCTTSSGLQPRTERAARAARAAHDLRTSHLFCPRAAQQRLDLARPRRLARDEDAELVIREARIVGHGPQAPRAEHRQQARRGRRVEDGGERIDQLHAATALPRLGAGSTSFTSEIDTAGKFFTNSRNHMKNQPKLPAMMPQSAHVGLYVALENRSNGSPASDTTMITKRSNHIPMFTKMDTTNNAITLVRTFLDHNSHGNSPLQMFIVQLAHQNGPNARYQKAARSCGLPPNQAVKFSVQYDILTIMPVSRHSFARFSK